MELLSLSDDPEDLKLVRIMLNDMPTVAGPPALRNYQHVVRALARTPGLPAEMVMKFIKNTGPRNQENLLIEGLLYAYKKARNVRALAYCTSQTLHVHFMTKSFQYLAEVLEPTATTQAYAYLLQVMEERTVPVTKDIAQAITRACRRRNIAIPSQLCATDVQVQPLTTPTAGGHTAQIVSKAHPTSAPEDLLSLKMMSETNPDALLEAAKRLHVVVQPQHWTLVIANATRQSLALGLQAYHAAKQGDQRPTRSMIEPLVKSLLTSRIRRPTTLAVDTVIQLWRDIKDQPADSKDGPDLSFYSIVFRSIFISRHPSSLAIVWELALHLKESGVLIDPASAKFLVHKMATSASHELVVEYFRALRVATGELISADLYNTTLRALTRITSPRSPFVPPPTYFEVLRDMTWRGIPIKSRHYAEVLLHYTSVGQSLHHQSEHRPALKDAVHVVVHRIHMDQLENFPRLHLDVAAAFIAVREYKLAVKKYREVVKAKRKLRLNAALLSQVVQTGASAQLWTDVTEIWKATERRRRNLFMPPAARAAAVLSLCRAGLLDDATAEAARSEQSATET
ncbi:hypothetical protein BKA62DRAFT_765621 [Auriculariales sp. MPI-PUGE-AT-0066]|nr:hypothetical protein BKA62DRAFT_765621 [Auriculariales sp. MPI-PUGE-AT-0066]